MFLMIDNYDSFVYNLKAYFEELGREIMVRRSDQINIEEIEKMQPEGIILSPGPKRPWDAVRCVETVKRFQGKIPILGVCLGHQVLGHCCGAVVEKGSRPMHGKVTGIRNNGTGLFEGLPEKSSTKQRIAYRCINIGCIKDKEERKRILQIQRAIAIPQKPMTAAEVGSLFG